MVWNGKYDRLYIGGEWVSPQGDERIKVISPFTEQPVASVPSASIADVDRAVSAARKAFDHGPWPRLPLEERIAVVQRLSDAFSEHRETLAQLITDEMGSPITFSRNVQVVVPKLMLESFIDIARSYPLASLRQSPAGTGLVTRQPKGVVAAIVPWNVPMNTAIIKLGPALLMGCCVILKPAPEAPLSSYLLAEMLEQAGVPKGVISILPAERESSEYLALHPGVDKVTFTGSTNAGRHLAARCGELVRPVTLELGGKSAAIFLDDADITPAVESLRFGSLRNSGQICTLKTRILVSQRREQEVIDQLVALMTSMPVGDPNDPATQIGPMASKRQMERVAGYIDIGVKEGATLVHGGPGRPAGLTNGWFVKPTLFSGVDPNATIAQDEIFGPVLAISTYRSEDEAIEIANNSTYGLNGAIFSADVEKAIKLAAEIKTGTVEINGCGAGFHSPIGGVKLSGMGREAGPEGFDHYVEFKSIGVPGSYAESMART
jgi:aldehyde dehydrogenase (NAD+)